MVCAQESAPSGRTSGRTGAVAQTHRSLANFFLAPGRHRGLLVSRMARQDGPPCRVLTAHLGESPLALQTAKTRRHDARPFHPGRPRRTSAVTSRRQRLAQRHMPPSGGMNVRPSGVSEYSTASAFDRVTRRAINPVDSRLRSVRVSMRCETLPRRRRSCPCRYGLSERKQNFRCPPPYEDWGNWL